MVLLSKLAIIESGSPDTVVTLSNVAEGGEGATRQGFSIEPVESIIKNEQLLWQKADYSLQMAGIKGSGSDKTQLDTWADDETDLIFSGYGTGVIFQGRGKLNIDPGLGEDVATWRIESAKRAVRGYDDSDGRYHAQMILSENGFNEYLWGSSGDVADGWDDSTDGTFSFSSGAQTIEADNETAYIEREVYFPFPSKEVTFFMEVDSYDNASNLTRTLKMEYLDASGSTLSTDSETFTGTGKQSMTGTLPDNTHSINFQIEITEGGTAASSITFQDAGFRIDNSTKYIQQ